MQLKKFEVTFLILLSNGILISEFARKFLIGGQLPLIVYELFCMAIASVVFWKIYRTKMFPIVVLLWAILVWGLFTAIMSEYSPIFLFFGLRAVLFPFACLIIGVRLVDLIGVKRFLEGSFRFVVFWLILITSIAIVQLILGPTHFVTVGTGLDEAQGLGGWGYGSDLFRTTSIFQHTGKYGQITFLLACYSMFSRKAFHISGPTGLAISFLEIFSILISGQRAAFLGYVFVFLSLNILSKLKPRVFYFWILVLLIFVFFAQFLNDNDVLNRVFSSIEEFPSRFTNNVSIPLDFVLGEYMLLGVGFGVLSFGAGQFGGELLTKFVTVGNAESSFVRIIVETGVFGATLTLLLILFMTKSALSVVKCRSFFNSINASQCKLLGRYVAGSFTFLLVWSATHDVLGATATMGTMFFFSAPIFARSAD